MTTGWGRRLTGVALAAALAPVALAACGGSGRSASAKRVTPISSSPIPSSVSTVTTTPGTSTSSGSGRSTTTQAGSATITTSAHPTPGGRCLSNQLQGARGPGGGAAAGHIVANYVLRNASATTCALDGYPGLQMLDAQGHPLPTVVDRGAAMGLAAVPPRLVTLPPGGSASFSLAYEDVPSGGETTCPTSAQLEITPPNDFDHLVVGASLSPCRGGAITVSPVVAGASGIQSG